MPRLYLTLFLYLLLAPNNINAQHIAKDSIQNISGPTIPDSSRSPSLNDTVLLKACEVQHMNFQDSTRFETAYGESNKYQWVGTNHGLYSVNKHSGIINFLIKGKSKLPDDYITGIACMLNGHTYISTKNGILLWENHAFLLMNTENTPLPENHIIGLSVGPEDSLLIHTKNCGILKAIGRCIRIYKFEKPKTIKA